MAAIILACTCKHEGQDKLHNKRRVFNTMQKEKEARCTVCGTVRKY